MENNKKIKIGLIGLGTVGSGVFKTLGGFDHVEIVKIAVKNKNKKRDIENLDEGIITDNPYEIVNDPSIDIVVELIGGIEPAFDLIKTAISNGKHIVTANKELLAKHGEELFRHAEAHNRVVLYEAAVAGGIPIITPVKTIFASILVILLPARIVFITPVKTILAGNNITKIEAILNGTTNYILTKMDVEGASYEDVLKEAQKLGYAEADPTSDVEGYDSAYKIAILSSISFKKRINIDNVYKEGISKIKAQDIKAANDLGYKIKLVALAQIDKDEKVDVRVHPMLVSKDSILAHIDYVKNAIKLEGYPVGSIALSGAGAGEFPTASSVIGDILAIADELGTTDYLLPMMRCKHKDSAQMINIMDTVNKYYLSINAKNEKGVIGKIGAICAENNISLASIVQRRVEENNTADIAVITEMALERDVRKTIDMLEADESINTVASLIRVQTDK